jgi:hypothetical protein
MWLVSESGKIKGLAMKCMSCGYATLDYNQRWCPQDQSVLKEILLGEGE